MSKRVLRVLAAASLAAATVGVTAGPAGAGRPHASCGYRSTYSAPNHDPKADRNWVVRVRVSPTTLTTGMHYEFYFGGRRVATRYVRNQPNFTFRGHMADAVVWPKRSIGIPLVFRVVLHNRCGTKHWDWSVKVRR